MLKILRKYNKWILGIGGSLLMVTFLFTGTSSLFQPDPRKRVVAEVGGSKVRAAELGRAEAEQRALAAFAPGTMLGLMGIQDGTHWLLISREAAEAGLVGEAADGREWLPELARIEAEVAVDRDPQAQLYRQFGMYAQMVDQRASQILPFLESRKGIVAAESGGLSVQDFEVALAKLRGVRRLVSAYSEAPRFSAPRAAQVGRKLIDAVFVEAVVIPADARAAQVAEPTEEQLKAHFEKFRAVEPGTGELGFGYVQPERVKLEWIELNRAAIEGAITIDPLAAYRAWQADRTQFAGEFEAERAKVETLLRSQAVETVFGEAERIVKAIIRTATRRLVTDGGVKRLPPDWETDRPKMADLAMAIVDGVKSATGHTIPLPRVVERTDQWIRVAEAGRLDGIGAAQFRFGTTSGTLPQLLAATHELSPAGGVLLQARVPFDASLRDQAGNVYFLTVLDARKPAPADSLEEVRAEVIADVRQAAAFALLASEQSAILAKAIASGLDGVAAEFLPATPMEQAVVRPIRVTRESVRGGPASLNTQAVRDQILAIADGLGSTVNVLELSPAQKSVVVPLPAARSVALIQLRAIRPMTSDDLRQMTREVGLVLSREEVRQRELAAPAPEAAVPAPFSLEALKQRAGFRDFDKAATDPSTPANAPAQGST
jgi:hypothetical protein